VYEEKKAEGQLRSARATCVELDERDDRGVRIWLLFPSRSPELCFICWRSILMDNVSLSNIPAFPCFLPSGSSRSFT
jgi:hypothetical protein